MHPQNCQRGGKRRSASAWESLAITEGLNNRGALRDPMLACRRMQRTEFDPGVALQAGLWMFVFKANFLLRTFRKNPRRSCLTDCGSSQDNKTKGNWCCLSLQMGNVDISSICLTADSWHSLWEIILGGKETSQTPPLLLPWAPLGSHWVLWITSPGMSPLQSGVLHPFRRINVFLQPSPRARARDWGVHREKILGGYKGCWHQWGQAATPQPRRGTFR